jgi:hypothetical protein
MVIAPPSRVTKGTYRWLNSVPVVDAPTWLLDLLRRPRQHDERKPNGNGAWNGSNTPYAQAAQDRECERVSTATKSKRNHTLNNAAFALGQLIAGGELDRTDVETRLFNAAVACGLVKDDGESGVWATIKSGITAAIKEPRSTPHHDEDTAEKDQKTNSIKTIRASNVKQEPITWIWKKRLAQGKITILSGDPGLGKSQIAIDIVARITRGSKWCDGGMAPLGNCIILSAEDAANDTICPRLEVAGANLDRVEIIESVVTKDGDRSFSLAHDLGALTGTVKRIGNVSLIVIDPVTAYLGDKIDSHQKRQYVPCLNRCRVLPNRRASPFWQSPILQKQRNQKRCTHSPEVLLSLRQHESLWSRLTNQIPSANYY